MCGKIFIRHTEFFGLLSVVVVGKLFMTFGRCALLAKRMSQSKRVIELQIDNNLSYYFYRFVIQDKNLYIPLPVIVYAFITAISTVSDVITLPTTISAPMTVQFSIL